MAKKNRVVGGSAGIQQMLAADQAVRHWLGVMPGETIESAAARVRNHFNMGGVPGIATLVSNAILDMSEADPWARMFAAAALCYPAPAPVPESPDTETSVEEEPVPT